MNPWDQEQMQQFRSNLHETVLKTASDGERTRGSALRRVLRMTWNKVYHRKTLGIQPADLDVAKQQLRKLSQPG
jgi:hypothetical protein